MTSKREAIMKAVEDGKFVIPCSSYQQANNYRQRLYRYREKLRHNSSADPLALIADSINFKIDGTNLVIEVSEFDITVWENINDDQECSLSRTQTE